MTSNGPHFAGIQLHDGLRNSRKMAPNGPRSAQHGCKEPLTNNGRMLGYVLSLTTAVEILARNLCDCTAYSQISFTKIWAKCQPPRWTSHIRTWTHTLQ